MDKREWEQIEEIIDTALKRSGEKRKQFIAEQCGDDEELKQQITTYLNAITESTGFLEDEDTIQKQLFIQDYIEDSDAPGSSLIGTVVGNYEIIELLGYGGLGSVFLAERADGEFEHQVALKVLRRGMDTPKNISRFQLEREILAELSHPNIAQLYDGGVTEDGLPYLIMEYIDGTPIDVYCDEQQLSIAERLSLFEDICDSVQYAHNNLIIHRDLKPSNIMVTEGGDVKVLDFGISKLIRDEMDESATETKESHQMLTPGYAAPEQFSYEAITTAIDNYALGALLYKLLAGVPLFDLDGKNRSEIEQIVTDKTPIAPSTRLQELSQDTQKRSAEKRNTSIHDLISTLKGDLDAIILKAVRKEPDARYESPGQLKQDIQRYRNEEAVAARSGAFSYHFAKFIKRNRWPIAAAAVLILLSTGFGIFYTYQIAQERDKAQLEALKAQEVTNFLTDLIEANAPGNTQGKTVTIREFLESSFQKVQELDKTPAVRAEILSTMGHTYRSLGDLQKASILINDALQIQDSIDVENKQAARTYNIYGIIQRDLGNLDSAQTALSRSVAMYRSTGNTNNNQYAKALRDWAYVERLKANYEKASSLAREALQINRRLNKQPSVRTAETLYVLASILRYQNKLDKAIETQKESLQMVKKVTNGPHPGVAFNYTNLANLYDMNGDLKLAKKYYEQALAMSKTLFGKGTQSIANIHGSISSIYLEEGQLDSAKFHAQKSITIQKRISADNHNLGTFYDNLAKIYAAKSQFSVADSLLDERLKILNKNFESDHPKFEDIKISRARIAVQRGDENQAIQLLTNVLEKRKEDHKMSDRPVQKVLYFLTDALEQAGKQAKADSLSQYLD